MDHHVFLSHTTPDRAAADEILAILESRGIRCWVAWRDARPGEAWGTAIVRAIARARVVVLVLSSHANASEHVAREVQLAFERKLTVIPFRTEDVAPADTLEYYLTSVHRIDALAPDLAGPLRLLVDRVRACLGASPEDPSSPVADPPPSPPASPRPDGPAADPLGPEGAEAIGAPEAADPTAVAEAAETPDGEDVPGPAAEAWEAAAVGPATPADPPPADRGDGAPPDPPPASVSGWSRFARDHSTPPLPTPPAPAAKAPGPRRPGLKEVIAPILGLTFTVLVVIFFPRIMAGVVDALDYVGIGKIMRLFETREQAAAREQSEKAREIFNNPDSLRILRQPSPLIDDAASQMRLNTGPGADR